MINVQNENKVYTIDEKELKSYEMRGYKKIEAEKPAPPQEKPFSQKGANDQIAYIATIEDVEALEALLNEAGLKPTAKTALESKIEKVKAAKVDADNIKFEALKKEAEGLEGVEILPEDTLETLQSKVDAKKAEGKQPE